VCVTMELMSLIADIKMHQAASWLDLGGGARRR